MRRCSYLPTHRAARRAVNPEWSIWHNSCHYNVCRTVLRHGFGGPRFSLVHVLGNLFILADVSRWKGGSPFRVIEIVPKQGRGTFSASEPKGSSSRLFMRIDHGQELLDLFKAKRHCFQTIRAEWVGASCLTFRLRRNIMDAVWRRSRRNRFANHGASTLSTS